MHFTCVEAIFSYAIRAYYMMFLIFTLIKHLLHLPSGRSGIILSHFF